MVHTKCTYDTEHVFTLTIDTSRDDAFDHIVDVTLHDIGTPKRTMHIVLDSGVVGIIEEHTLGTDIDDYVLIDGHVFDVLGSHRVNNAQWDLVDMSGKMDEVMCAHMRFFVAGHVAHRTWEDAQS